MTTKKMFYTCPIKALWMMKQFRMAIKHPKHIGSIVSYNSYPVDSLCLSDLEYFLTKSNRIYVAEESYPIFEPKLDDFGIVKGESSSPVKLETLYIECAFYDEEISPDKIEIIMRDKKPFFTPEIDGASQSQLNNKALNKIPFVKDKIANASKHNANQMTQIALREMMNSAKAIDDMSAFELTKFEFNLIDSFKFRGYIA